MTEPLVFRGPEGSITLTAAALTGLVAVPRAASTAYACAGLGERSRSATPTVARRSRSSWARRPAEPLPGVARAVQERVGEALARVTGLEVERVDIEIAEIG